MATITTLKFDTPDGAEQMAYEITIEEVDGILRAEVSGQRNGQASEELLWSRLGQEYCQRNAKAALVILKLKGRSSIIEHFQVAAYLEKYNWTRLMRLAIVDLEESSPDSSFWALVATNRGYTVKAFDSVEGAETYLKDYRASHS